MIIKLDNASSIPIYVQLRNQIVLGIGRGDLKIGESLPTVRQMAQAAEINVMTVNKVYAILKAEGYIEINRRHGAIVRPKTMEPLILREKCEQELELIITETSLQGMDRDHFLKLCNELFEKQKILAVEPAL